MPFSTNAPSLTPSLSLSLAARQSQSCVRALWNTCRDTPPGRLRTVEGDVLMPVEYVIFETLKKTS